MNVMGCATKKNHARPTKRKDYLVAWIGWRSPACGAHGSASIRTFSDANGRS